MVYASEFNDTKCPDTVHKSWNIWLLIVNRVDMKNRILLIVFNVILIFSAIILNLLSVVTIRKSSQLKNKLCYFVILVQSVVDLGIGVFSIPLFIIYLAAPLLGIQNCLAIVILLVSALLAPALSVGTLTTMTVERYIGVLHPYSYPIYVTRSHIKICVSVWSFTMITSFILLIHAPISALEYSISVVLLAQFFFTAYAYMKIYLVIRTLERSEKRPVDIARQISKKRRLLREIKHAKSCFIVVLCFALCMLPSAMGPIFVDMESAHYAAFSIWTMTLYNLNSSFNSIIFFWNKTLLRNEAAAILNSIFSGLH